MTNKPNSRGSEWRKWDLHLHSFYTNRNNNFGQDKQAYIDKITRNNIAVVGLTNYFNFSDNDYNLKDELTKKGIVVFLNLELRLSYTNKENDCTDFHIIFSNTLERKQIDNFLANVNAKIGASEKKLNTICTRDDKDKAVVEFDEIEKLIKNDNSFHELRDGVLMGFLSRGKGNGRSSTTYEHLSDKCHFLIHSSDKVKNLEEDREYWLNQNKPLLNSSDAHKIADIGLKFTWIKADPTFEGLKQIIYEPTDRVRIQDEKPEQKPADKTIDKVQFDSNDFTKNEILLNQNLTVIIGGKSTGKSILLKKIAQTVDSEEVAKKTKDIIANPSVDDIQFKVLWKDGRENNDKRKIIYIPQSYLNRLADEKNDDKIIKIIRDALEQEDVIKNIFHKVKIQQDDNQTEINKNINALFTQKENIVKMQNNIKVIGVKSTIEEAIQGLKKEIADEKLKTSDVTDGDFEQYEKLLETQETLNKNLTQYDKDKKVLENIKKADLFEYPECDELSYDVKNSVYEYLKQIKTKYLIEWDRDIDLEITKVIKLNTENNVKIAKNNESLKPLKEKMEKAKTLNEKIKLLTVEQDRLKKIIDEELKLKAGKDNFNTLKNRIVDLHIEFFNLLVSAKADVLKQTTIKKENGLEFDVSIEFQKNSFASRENGAISFVNSYCDGRKIGNHELNDYQFSDIDGYKTDFQKWINELLDGTFPLSSKVQMLDAIKGLANNWFEFKYHITHDGDKILEMSPGKRSFVILKLLIELDNTNKCPILLDQPEDDLDNRSIFTELVKFIKEKKKERQIIITTHNPNLVVGTDAECVIVANQHGEKTKNIDNIKFNYIQGALENIHKDKGDLALDKQSIQGHVCYILEGGQDAFEKRRKKYNFDKLKNAN